MNFHFVWPSISPGHLTSLFCISLYLWGEWCLGIVHLRCLHVQGMWGSSWPPTGLSKGCYHLRSCLAGARRKKIDLCGWAGIFADGEGWVTTWRRCSSVQFSSVKKRGNNEMGRENFMFKFFLSYLNIQIFISSPKTFYSSTLLIWRLEVVLRYQRREPVDSMFLSYGKYELSTEKVCPLVPFQFPLKESKMTYFLDHSLTISQQAFF